MERFTSARLVTSGGEPDGLAAAGRDLLNHCVDPVRTPRSKYNFCSLFCEKLRVLSPMPLLAPVITTTLLVNI